MHQLLAETSQAGQIGLALAFVASLASGVVLEYVRNHIKGNNEVRNKLDAKADQLVTNKFEGLSGDFRRQLDGHGDRIKRVEGRLETLAEERHNDRLSIANEINALRTHIATTTASKSDVASLAVDINKLAIGIAALSAITENRREA